MPGRLDRRRLRVAVLAVAAVAVVVLLVLSLRSQYDDVRARLHEIGIGALVGCVAAGAAGTVASMLAWRSLLADLGSPLPLPAAARVFFLGQLGKYVPGSVWSVLGQMELAKAYAVPRARSATSSAVALVVSVLSGLLVAAALLPVFARHAAAAYWPAFLVLPVVVVALLPPVLTRLLQTALRLARRAPLDAPVTARGVGGAVGWSALTWLAWGAGLWLLARDEGAAGPRSWAVCAGAFALAWVAGFLVIFVPAGAGVREAVLVAVLGPALGLPAGAPLLLALVMRLALTISDVVLGLAALPGLRRRGAPT